MAIIIIRNETMPSPTEYSVVRQDLDSENTNRSETGMLNRERIRAGVYKISITWTVQFQQLKKLATALSPDKIAVRFFDPNTASMQSAQMYAGDRNSSLVSHLDDNNPNSSVWEYSCSLTEY